MKNSNSICKMSTVKIDRNVFLKVFVQNTTMDVVIGHNDQSDDNLSNANDQSIDDLIPNDDHLTLDQIRIYIDRKLSHLTKLNRINRAMNRFGFPTFSEPTQLIDGKDTPSKSKQNDQKLDQRLLKVKQALNSLLEPNHSFPIGNSRSSIESSSFGPDNSADRSSDSYGHITSNNARLGPTRVQFDFLSRTGLMDVDSVTNTLTGSSSFSTIRGNVCVASGRWQYEVMVNTRSVMQIGWASVQCRFSSTEGVGDTERSFAYDGCRSQRWNVQSSTYGERWQIGDVIGVCIDLNAATVSFFRNGCDLGVAFDRVPCGPGCAYYPALSLSRFESVVVNFGGTPFRYPISGYSPLELMPNDLLLHANVLVEWLFNLVLVIVRSKQSESTDRDLVSKSCDKSLLHFCLDKIRSTLLAQIILESLVPLLATRYTVEACLLKHLLWYHNADEIHALLDLCWSLLDNIEMNQLLSHLIYSLVNGYKFSSVCDPDAFMSEFNSLPLLALSSCASYTDDQRAPKEAIFLHQKQHLLLFLTLMQHSLTRSHTLQHILFDYNALVDILDIRIVCDLDIVRRKILTKFDIETIVASFETSLDRTDLQKSSNPCQHELYLANSTQSPASSDSERYWKSLTLEHEIQELECIQNLILDTLLFQDESCRKVFVQRFVKYLTDKIDYIKLAGVSNSVHFSSIGTTLPVLLSVFHRLISLIRQQYENVIQDLPLDYHLDPKLCSPELARIGGRFEHLSKTYDAQVKAYRASIGQQRNSSKNNPLVAHVHVLIDHLIGLYSSATHKQLETYNKSKETLLDLATSVIRMRRFGSTKSDACLPLQTLLNQFWSKCARFAMLNHHVFSSTRRSDLIWLLRLLLNTLEHASHQGALFVFLPDYYLQSCLNICFALRFYFANENIRVENAFLNVSCPQSDIQRNEFATVLQQFCAFVAGHLYDDRIELSDHKELVSHSLSSLILYPQSLLLLESVAVDIRRSLICKLALPYEHNSWVDSNWILLRFWKGNGFAYRPMPHKFVQTSNPIDSLSTGVLQNKFVLPFNINTIRPLPSKVFQQMLTDHFGRNRKAASAFLDSLLQKLNWTFSQCVSTLQEIQAFTINSDRHASTLTALATGSPDANQAKMCCACFELCLALLRVLEMILHCNAKLVLAIDLPGKSYDLTEISPNYDDRCESPRIHSLTDKMQQTDRERGGAFLGDTIFDGSIGLDDFFCQVSTPVKSGTINACNIELDEQRTLDKQCENHVLLRQLCCTLNQILNRVTMSSSCFAYVQQIAGVKMFSEFSILSAVAAILVALIVRHESTRTFTLHMLVSEPSFQLSSFLYMIGGQTPKLNQSMDDSQIADVVASGSSNQSKCDVLRLAKIKSFMPEHKFNFADYGEVMQSNELQQVHKLLVYVARYHEKCEKYRWLDEIHEDDICTICYACKKTARFIPCNHQSCKNCIIMHFLRSNECFFCKSVLEKVTFEDPDQILYPNREKKINVD